MNYRELAELLFPEVKNTIEDYEKLYPMRNLSDGKEVCRFAPSPTGRMHLGNLFASFIPEVYAHQSNGVFILRIEDTDDKRAIENGVNLIFQDLKAYNYKIDENPIDGGNYGPYVQSERKEIYAAFAKYLVSVGKAYPCFCTENDLEAMRNVQETKKDRVGYYGKYAKCRNLTIEEIKNKISKGEKYVIRLKSAGDFNKKISFKDLIKGTIELPENDIDHVLLKSDGIPPYAFAHVVDDYLMRVTIVTRDDSYISSVPYHLEIWNAFGFKVPKFAHILPLCIKDNNSIRKISKRKDPEAAVSFYHEKGIPVEAIKLYFATLLNSNFEMWYLQNQDKSFRDFKFTFDKMTTSGSLFDLEKLLNISKNYFSRLKAKDIYENLLIWTAEFDKSFKDLLNKNKDYTINILNIEREVSRPRKDFGSYGEIKNQIYYMYEELFYEECKYENIEIKNFYSSKLIKNYLNEFYNEKADKDTWFNTVKEFAGKNGFAAEVKEYKSNPDSFKGHVGDICELIRVISTGRTMTPDLYEILKLLGKDKILKRIEYFNKLMNI